MIEITSKDNSLIKRAMRLRNKKFRDETGEFFAEGRRLVYDIYNYDRGLVVEILAGEDANCDIATAIISTMLAKKLSLTENSQDIFAIVKKPEPKAITGSVLFLDRVRDPGNVGTLIRTAAAIGFNDILLCGSADCYSDKVVRGSMSALVKVNVLLADFDKLLELKNNGYSVICADISGQNAYSYKAKSDKICLVVGNEASGISNEIRSMADVILSLPMDSKVESLNAAVSGGILMYNLKNIK